MNDLIIASSAEDAAALEAIEEHHAQLDGALRQHVAALVTAVAGGADGRSERDALVAWADRELVPHALAEEKTLYAAGQDLAEARLLLESMLAEHAALGDLVTGLRDSSGTAAVALAGGLRSLFEVHLSKENEQLLPLLVRVPEIAVTEQLALMRGLLSASAEAAQSAEGHIEGTGHTCACGGHDDSSYPELDARAVPHAIRHATVFGALDAVRPGGGLVLIAPHDPLPLLRQLEQRAPDAFEVSYLERGPEAWRLLLQRR